MEPRFLEEIPPMLGFGGCPLSAEQDVLLHGRQEVFGVLSPLPEHPREGNSQRSPVEDEAQSLTDACTTPVD
jgi:hypothetical protein